MLFRSGTQTAFSLGVAVNHGAADLDREVARLEAKVAAGAEYAITQPVFAPAALERLLKRIAHLKIPVISTIWPLADFAEAQYAANECGLLVPEALSTRIAAGDNVTRELVAELRKISAGLRITTRGGSIETAVNAALH